MAMTEPDTETAVAPDTAGSGAERYVRSGLSLAVDQTLLENGDARVCDSYSQIVEAIRLKDPERAAGASVGTEEVRELMHLAMERAGLSARACVGI